MELVEALLEGLLAVLVERNGGDDLGAHVGQLRVLPLRVLREHVVLLGDGGVQDGHRGGRLPPPLSLEATSTSTSGTVLVGWAVLPNPPPPQESVTGCPVMGP